LSWVLLRDLSWVPASLDARAGLLLVHVSKDRTSGFRRRRMS
jgi:hypothetical protein